MGCGVGGSGAWGRASFFWSLFGGCCGVSVGVLVCCFLVVFVPFCCFFVPFLVVFLAFFSFLVLAFGRRACACWRFVVLFSFLVVSVSSLPAVVAAQVSGASSFGFCGSRSAVPPASLWASFVSLVPSGASVSCGCVGGLCALARGSFPSASVFRASSFGRSRGAFAARSVALVRSVAAAPSPLWVSFPGRACPAGLVPCPAPSRCFRGLGSGSWASLAFAVGLGVPALVWLPAGVSFPSGWSASCVGSGWWFVPSPQLLF